MSGQGGGGGQVGEGATDDAVREAMSKIQTLLDRLTAHGQHAAAFQIARAQFSASVRASWPANLSAVATAIDKAVIDGAAVLTDEERAELQAAADVLRSVPHP